MRMARVSSKGRSRQPVDDISREVLEYQTLKQQIDDLDKRAKVLRDSLMEAVKVVGDPDDKGHLWMELDEEINGVHSVLAEKRRRSSRSAALPIAARRWSGSSTTTRSWPACTRKRSPRPMSMRCSTARSLGR
jgi:hypothetical protein